MILEALIIGGTTCFVSSLIFSWKVLKHVEREPIDEGEIKKELEHIKHLEKQARHWEYDGKPNLADGWWNLARKAQTRLDKRRRR